MIEAAVFGARGYLGRTLVKTLADHPHLQTVIPVSTSVAGRTIDDVLPCMKHESHVAFVEPEADEVAQADVAFLARGSAEAEEAAEELQQASPGPSLVVDLSRAHRLPALQPDGGAWTYGLPDLEGWVQKGDTLIANPGCYPTAALLAIGPALEAGLLAGGTLVVDGKSGVSGAGATPRADLHFPEANESLRAYGVEEHDHQGEIQAALAHLEADGSTSGPRPVRFVPHLVPQNRGLLATVYAPLEASTSSEDVDLAYGQAYAGSQAVQIVPEPDTSHVQASNQAHVGVTVDQGTGLLVARCAIDNLVKGGAGSAVQNMNRALGFDEQAGVPLAGVTP